jgi:hypothetical protein
LQSLNAVGQTATITDVGIWFYPFSSLNDQTKAFARGNGELAESFDRTNQWIFENGKLWIEIVSRST